MIWNLLFAINDIRRSFFEEAVLITVVQEILKRYGYLRCGSFKRRASASKHKEGRHGGRRCTNEEIRNAIRRYQNTYNMPATGQLDQATLKLMSESRCGNPDDESRAARFKPMIHPRKRHWRKGHSYQPLARHRRDISSEIEHLFDIDVPPKEVPSEKQDLPEAATTHLQLSNAEEEGWSQTFSTSPTLRRAMPVHEMVMGRGGVV
ncbi:matrix metalloproteinase-21 [Caerostris extrusa]|uniref:Matrix metalloproteinase-21 n=1 Tax=Caerostris extrusa TaxID=172846 RepID=A0AAV4XCX8_CAEEX|nr:matrix metalloproteinase-21 [Caerostris extrusa]